VALDVRGNVYVADTANARIQQLSPFGRSLAVWGSKGRGPGQLWSPTAIALDSSGFVYVADEGNSRLLKLSPSGDPVAQWGSRHRLVTRPPGASAGAEPDGWRVGGYYSLDLGDGGIAIGRVLVADALAMHLRLYRDRLPHRPKDDRLPPVTLGDPGDPDGVGLRHLAVTARLFTAWRPAFVYRAELKPRHLREYRAWQAVGGPVWDLASDGPLTG
jgi:hypothetical protein